MLGCLIGKKASPAEKPESWSLAHSGCGRPEREVSEEKSHRKTGAPGEAAGDAVRERKVHEWLLSG